jgi:hypothetical protein
MGEGRQHHLSPRQSNSSIQWGSESLSSYAHEYPEYLALDPSTVVHDVQWVYEWKNPEFYSMLVSEWQTTGVWTGQTWSDYKASLTAHRRIVLMSINDYHMAHYTYMMSHWVLCMCMCRTMCLKPLCCVCVEQCAWNHYVVYVYNYILKPIYGCVQLSIYATWCICDQCITYLFVGQLLMVLHGWVFLWPFLLLSCQIYVMHTTESKNFKKKSRKISIYALFLINCAPTGLPLPFTKNTDW